jgi:hypothetical protein
MKTMTGSMFGLVVAGALAGCAAVPDRTPMVVHATASLVEVPAYVAYVDSCPLSHLRGVRAAVEDLPTGVAIVFTGPGRVVDMLRNNVHAMAAASVHEGNPFAVCPCRGLDTEDTAQATRAPGKTDLGVTSMQAAASPLAAAAVTAEDTPTGARLELTGDSSEAATLQSLARRQVHAMAECLPPLHI